MVARSGGLQLSGLLPRRTGLRHAPLDRPHRRTAPRPPCPLVPARIFRMTVAFAEVGARTNFTLLDGASHPAEMVATAAVLGHAGIGVCDTNSLAGVVRAHVAAKDVGIRFVVGTRLVLDDGVSYLAWPTDRASYGRLTRLLSLGRMRAPKGQCQLRRSEMLDHAEGWVMAALPPSCPDAPFATRLKIDARDLQDRLAIPLLCSAPVIY